MRRRPPRASARVSGGRPAWRLPPSGLARRPLPIVELPPAPPVVRIHTVGRDPRYFGRTGQARFEAPDSSYGVCVRAGGSTTRRPSSRPSSATRTSAASPRPTWPPTPSPTDIVRPTRLVAFGGPGLRRLHATAGTVHATYSGVTQAWSRALWAHPDQPDGIRYRSRFDDDQHCVALFDRAAAAVRFAASAPLSAVPLRLGTVLDRYGLALYD